MIYADAAPPKMKKEFKQGVVIMNIKHACIGDSNSTEAA